MLVFTVQCRQKATWKPSRSRLSAAEGSNSGYPDTGARSLLDWCILVPALYVNEPDLGIQSVDGSDPSTATTFRPMAKAEVLRSH